MASIRCTELHLMAYQCKQDTLYSNKMGLLEENTRTYCTNGYCVMTSL